MKKKLLLLICSLLTAIGTWAQGWQSSPVAEGNFYLYNVEAKAYFSHGARWGSHATVDNVGFVVNLTKVSDGVYTIGTNNYTDGKFFSSNGYADSGSTDWTFEEVAGQENTYKIKSGDNYAYVEEGLHNVMVGSDPGNSHAYWKLVTAANRNDLSGASSENPQDVTHLFDNPNFNYNTDGWTGALERGGNVVSTVWEDYATQTESSWNVHNPCMQSWNTKSYDMNQTKTSLTNGFYRITCQGFYRAGGSGTTETAQNAILYANNVESPLVNIISGAKEYVAWQYTTQVGSTGKYVPDQMYQASNVFSLGDYSLNSVEVNVTDASLKIGVKKDAEVSQDWTIVDNFHVYYLGNPKATLTTLQGTIDGSYLNNSDYANVTGEERTALIAAKTLTAASETAAAYEAAVASVQEAIDKFVAAKTNYDALASVNAKITAVGTLEYASSAKKPSTYDATSSSDAASHATSLTTALRAYVESNALGEGVGATNYTSSIDDAICPSNPSSSGSGDFVVITGTGWTIDRVRANTGAAWTDSEGTDHQPYYDSNGTMYNGYTGITTASMSQTVSGLPAGKYLLTVAARSSGTLETFYISGNGVQQAITSPNNVFGNGWDDTSVEFTVGAAGTAEIILYGKKANAGDTGRWFSADNFRLVRLGDATVSATIGTAGWTTFASPYALNLNGMTASEGDVKAYYASSMGDGKVTMTSTSQVGVQAGEGLMLKGNAGATITIPIEPSGTSIDGNKMKGCLVNTEITSETENYATFYVLVNGTDGAEFQNIKKYCDGGQTVTVPAGKAYLDATALAGARLTIVFNEDGFTGINAVEAAEAETGALKDGKYLINGKIVLVKNCVKYGANGQKLN